MQEIASVVRVARQAECSPVWRVDVRQGLVLEELAFRAARFPFHAPRATYTTANDAKSRARRESSPLITVRARPQPWRCRCTPARRLNAPAEVRAIRRVAITQQIARSRVPRECLGYLASQPRAVRIRLPPPPGSATREDGGQEYRYALNNEYLSNHARGVASGPRDNRLKRSVRPRPDKGGTTMLFLVEYQARPGLAEDWQKRSLQLFQSGSHPRHRR